jgi:hypothetical protein
MKTLVVVCFICLTLLFVSLLAAAVLLLVVVLLVLCCCRDQEMNQVLNMELGYSVISLASRLHFLDTITSQHIVNVFVTMMNTEGCVNRHMVEGFICQVFLKYLHVAWYLVSNQVRHEFALVELLCPVTDAPSFANAVEVELLEYLVDSLCDLLASMSFLPSLYATFDCNLSSPDLAGALIKNISNLSR